MIISLVISLLSLVSINSFNRGSFLRSSTFSYISIDDIINDAISTNTNTILDIG